MSELSIRKLMGEKFPYQYMDGYFSKAEIEQNYQRLMKHCSVLTKKWTQELNTEWVVRDYLAVKMIFSSTLMLNSAEYAYEKNIRIVEPYLTYYALLNCSRAVIFTSPLIQWNNGELFEMTHSKTINVVSDIISAFNKDFGGKCKQTLEKAMEYRELFSYKFPAKGIGGFSISIYDTITLCQLLCEIAQYQSELLEKSIDKNVATSFTLDKTIIEKVFTYQGQHYNLIDEDDNYRLNYIYRKHPRPFNLSLTMTEGMRDDFFGAWYPEDDSDLAQMFNPDDNWGIIFPIH